MRVSGQARLGVRVVNDHVVALNPRRLVFFRNSPERIEIEPVSQLHDVGLMNHSHFLRQYSPVSRVDCAPRDGGIGTLRPFLSAKSNANRMIRSALNRVDTFKLSTTPGKL